MVVCRTGGLLERAKKKRHWSLLSVDIRVVIKDTRDRENIFNRNRKRTLAIVEF